MFGLTITLLLNAGETFMPPGHGSGAKKVFDGNVI